MGGGADFTTTFPPALSITGTCFFCGIRCILFRQPHRLPATDESPPRCGVTSTMLPQRPQTYTCILFVMNLPPGKIESNLRNKQKKRHRTLGQRHSSKPPALLCDSTSCGKVRKTPPPTKSGQGGPAVSSGLLRADLRDASPALSLSFAGRVCSVTHRRLCSHGRAVHNDPFSKTGSWN